MGDSFTVRCPRCQRPATIMGTTSEFRLWVAAHCPICHLFQTLTVQDVPYADLIAAGLERPSRRDLKTLVE